MEQIKEKRDERDYGGTKIMKDSTFYAINHNFYRDLIEFNAEFNRNPNIFTIEKIKSLNPIKIPFFPIKINPFLFNRLMAKFIHIINGTNGNSVELVINHRKSTIEEIIFIKTDENGNYLEYSKDTLRLSIEYDEIKDVPALFDKIKSYVLDNKYVDIGSIKLIHSQILDQYATIKNPDAEKVNYEQQLTELLDFVIDAVKNDKFVVYPKIRLYEFIKSLTKIYPDFQKIAHESNKLRNLFPRGKISLTLHSQDWYITLIVEITNDGTIKIISQPAFEFGKIQKDSAYRLINLIKTIGENYQESQNVEANYLVDVDWITDVLITTINCALPLSEDRIQLLLQKVLYGIRNVETMWDVYPKPIIYDENVRLLLRWFGYHINPRKVSYWSLPSIMSFLQKKIFGKHAKLLVLFSNHQTTGKKIDLERQKQYIDSLLKESWGILVTKSTDVLNNIHHLSNETIKEKLEKIEIHTDLLIRERKILYPAISEKKLKDKDLFELRFKSYLYELRKEFQKTFGFIDVIVYLNQNYIQEIIRANGVETMSWNPLKYIKIIKLLKQIKDSPDSFCLYPDLPFYQYFKEKGFGLTKELVPNLFDFREF